MAKATKAPAKKSPPGKVAATTGAKPAGGAPEVIVGRLDDWPLGARLIELLGLPKSATGVGCFQAVGPHGAAVSAKVFQVKETISPDFAPFEAKLHAALGICAARCPTQINTGFHANLSPEELADHLRGDYLVRTPAEALEARRLTPAQSLEKIEKSLEKASVRCPRKDLLAYLQGGAPRKAVLGADARGLSQLVAADPEVYNEVDARLFHLWARRTGHDAGPPMPPSTAELGFDRFGAHLAQLVAAGLQKDEAIAYFLRKRPMEHARWWPSTGVWVWERLLADPVELLQRTVVNATVEPFEGEIEDAITEILTSVLWLPKGALEAGARDAVLKVCASPALVPDRSLEALRKQAAFQPLLASLERSDDPRAPVWPTVGERYGRQLIAT